MKRFTETTKWSDPWFRKLEPKFKALWLYLVDSCDVAGVWNADLELASFHIGAIFEESEVEGKFGDRIKFLPNGKWFLTKFIVYQYGELNPENNCHKAVLRSLEANQIEGPIKGLKSPILGPMDKDKRKDKEEGESEGKQFPEKLDTPAFREVWARWEKHRREVKKKLTPEMVSSSLKKLAGYGPRRAIQIIEYTLVKGWQGLADEDKVPHSVQPSLPRSTEAWKNSAGSVILFIQDLKTMPTDPKQVRQAHAFLFDKKSSISPGGDAAKEYLRANLPESWMLKLLKEAWKEDTS